MTLRHWHYKPSEFCVGEFEICLVDGGVFAYAKDKGYANTLVCILNMGERFFQLRHWLSL